MAEKQRPLQTDMFTGNLVDNRTRKQKKVDKQQEAPQQMLMFSAREIALVGVNPRPKFSLSPQMQLRLLYPDFRTPAQIERDREQSALRQNKTLWETPVNQAEREVSLKDEALLLQLLMLQPDNVFALAMLSDYVPEDEAVVVEKSPPPLVAPHLDLLGFSLLGF